MSEKDVFLESFQREFATTMKVLKAYPQDKANLQPHPRCKTAKDLAWMFVLEGRLLDQVIKGKIDLTAVPAKAPESFDEVLAALQKQQKEKEQQVKDMSETDFNSSVAFPAGPGKMAEMRRADVMWMLLMDTVHHRGQFSIYLRMADGKVPSIYGPSGDEPWF